MFVVQGQNSSTLRPRTSQIAPNDWQVLSRYWYPVAVEGSVKQTPMKGRLLDVDLVIYRTNGKITVVLDRCPHRSVRLSAGQIADDRLVCHYHGLAFDAAGRCTSIPSFGGDADLPAHYRLRVFRSEIRYGLVWACLDDDSTEQIPVFRAGDEAGPGRLSFSLVRDWPASAPRVIENFIDVGHFPLIHAKTIGGDPHAAMPRARIEPTNNGFVATSDYQHRNTSIYTVTLPFAIEFDAPNALQARHMGFFAVPITADQTRVFLLHVTDGPSPSNEPQEKPISDAIAFEDIAVLATLAEQDFPLDAAEVIHLPVDNVSLEYRKQLLALGLGRP